jgi:hypothetical protein
MKAMKFPSNHPKGCPYLVSSSDEDDEEHLASEEFIRESAELFESEEDKKSRQRFLEFTQGEPIERLIALEKQTKVSDFPKSRPGSVKQFMRDIDSEKSAKDLLQDTSGPKERKYISAVSPRLPKINETPAGSDSEMESIATDSTRSTRKRSSSPWIQFKRYYHKEHLQAETRKLLEKDAFELIEVAGRYLPKKVTDTDLSPFKQSHQVSKF